MDMLICLTMLVLCFGCTDYFYEKSVMFKEKGESGKENINTISFMTSLIGIAAWGLVTLNVQPWRVGVPLGGGITVYHKDYPLTMTEEERLEAELKEKNDHESWMYMNGRVNDTRDSLNTHVSQQNTDRSRVFELEKEIKDLETRLARNEHRLKLHLDIRPDPGPTPPQWPTNAR